MSKAYRVTVFSIALATASAVLLSGCNKTQGQTQSEDNSQHVTLTYYYFMPAQPDLLKVQDAMNKILNKSINADIQLNPVPTLADYQQKMNLMVSAQEKFDLCWTSSWNFNYSSNATNGAFADLTKLLPQYAPKLYASLDSKFWKGVTVNGKIYAAINQQGFGRPSAVMFDKREVDKYNIDYKSLKTVDGFAKYLETVHQNEPDHRYIAQRGDAWLNAVMNAKGCENVGGSSVPGSIVSTDAKPKVFNEYDTPEYKDIVDTCARLQKEGIIEKDILTNPSIDRTNLVGTFTPQADAFSVSSAGEALSDGWTEGAYYNILGSAIETTSNVTGTLTAVSATSKNAARAVEYLEQINTNKELYNLLCHGTAGTHYTAQGDTGYKNLDNSKYSPGEDWVFGNQFNGLVPDGAPSDVWQQELKLNQDSPVSVLMGFSWDDTNVKPEEANVSAVTKQYLDTFSAGLYGDQTDAKYQEFLTALKNAGVDKIIADKQKQVDAFVAKK